MSETKLATHRTRDWGAVLFALVLPSVVTLAYFVWAEGSGATVQQAVYATAKLLQFAFPLAWVLGVQRQKSIAWPFANRGVWSGLGFGLLVTGAMFALFFGWLESTSVFAEAKANIEAKIAGLALDRLWKYVALGVFYSLLHSLLEEYYWRWFVFGQLEKLTSLGAAILISSLGFMAHHVIVLGAFFGFAAFITWFFSVSIAVGGAVWAWQYHRSGSLLGPWLGHLLVDAAIFAIGYQIARDVIGS